jgi:hypothetical protein
MNHIMETDQDKIFKGSVWKIDRDEKARPDSPHDNEDFFVSEVYRGVVRFGRAPDVSSWTWNPRQFLKDLYPVRPLAPLRAQLGAMFGILNSDPKYRDQAQELLLTLEI